MNMSPLGWPYAGLVVMSTLIIVVGTAYFLIWIDLHPAGWAAIDKRTAVTGRGSERR